MSVRSSFSLIALLLTLSLGAVSPCWAQGWVLNLTPAEVISANFLGFSSQIAILTVDPVSNPANCATTDFYLVDGGMLLQMRFKSS